MFYNCFSLSSLNISNFNTSQVTSMNNMFYNCSKLEYINFKNANISSNIYAYNIFPLTSETLIVCCEGDGGTFY